MGPIWLNAQGDGRAGPWVHHYPFASDVLQRLVGEDVRLLEGGTRCPSDAASARRARLTSSSWRWLTAAHRYPCLPTGIPAGLQDALARWLDIRLAVNTPELAAVKVLADARVTIPTG